MWLQPVSTSCSLPGDSFFLVVGVGERVNLRPFVWEVVYPWSTPILPINIDFK